MSYLVLEPDGSRASIRYLADELALARYLGDASEASGEGLPDPGWLASIPTGEYGQVQPGTWPEGSVLIVEVKRVVVPRPVTTKWTY